MKLRIFLAGSLLAFAQASQAQMCDPYSYYGYMTCYNLYVTVNGSGKVMGGPAYISCPGTCTGSYSGGNFTLSAVPGTGYNFTGWSGDCTGTGDGTVMMNDARNVTATFSSASPPVVTPETGFWYNATEGGRGYVIEQHGNNLFIGGFMYDASGNALWYASGPGAMSGSTYTGSWNLYAGGQTLTGNWKASSIINASVGSITLTFLTSTTATLTLPDARQVSLVRYPF